MPRENTHERWGRAWRRKNLGKWNDQKNRYYLKHRKITPNKWKHWSQEEVWAITEPNRQISDVELAGKLGRSVMAVQTKRSKTPRPI